MLPRQAQGGDFANLIVRPDTATQRFLFLSLLRRIDVNSTYMNDNNNDDYKYNLLQLSCYSVAVDILHVYRI